MKDTVLIKKLNKLANRLNKLNMAMVSRAMTRRTRIGKELLVMRDGIYMSP